MVTRQDITSDDDKIAWLAQASRSAALPTGFGESPRTLVLLLARKIAELEERIESLESEG